MRAEGGDEPGKQRERFLVECAAFYRNRIEQSELHAHLVAAVSDAVVGTISVHRVEMIPRPCGSKDHFGCITNNYVLPA